jgi:Holliday junction DNA helicase RuvB
VNRNARILGVELQNDVPNLIATSSRRTPRVANRLLKRIRDFAQVKGNGAVNKDIAAQALKMLEIDAIGLDRVDRLILETMIKKFNGGPVGLNTLAAATAEEIETIETIYEPFLIQLGLLNRTPRGRLATDEAYRHLGMEPPVRQNNLI